MKFELEVVVTAKRDQFVYSQFSQKHVSDTETGLGPDYMSWVPGAVLLWCSKMTFSPVLHEASQPGCHVIAKLIFMAFSKRAKIPATRHQPG